MYKAILFFIFIVCSLQEIYAQQSYTLSGYVRESGTGESLIGVNIYDKNNRNIGIVSNYYGFYSLLLSKGEHTIIFSYTGYQTIERKINIESDLKYDVNLSSGIEMEEVVISSDNPKKNIENTQMGTLEMDVENVKKLPALMGEVDILKALQLLPGVSSATEGTAGLYIRGGGPDQNLVLLDEAVVYNTGHLLGFFSVFNSDAIKNTTLIKGSMPAEYGSRISSVIDVQMKDGNNETYQAEGGVGLISSRLTLQGPIQKKKSSFIVSARRTYALDLAQPFINKTDFKGTNYYFYDLNLKANYKFSRKDRIYLSGYFGRDVFKFASDDQGFLVRLPYGNATSTLRWNHLFSDNTFFNLALIYNDYDFGLHGEQQDFIFDLGSGVKDFSAKGDLDYYPNPRHHVKSGFRYTYHKLTPNIVSATNGEVDFNSKFESKFGHENELYIMDDWSVYSLFKLNYGLRLSTFTQVGPYFSEKQNKRFEAGDPVKTYVNPEPRINFNYSLTDNQAIKGGFTYAAQYIHLVSNSGSTLPTDVWVPSTEKVKPQIGIQYALGHYALLADKQFETNVEVYYKDLKNQLEYRESYVENFTAELENEFISGKGKSYGIEFLIKKNKGKWTGWLGYTLSRTERKFEEVENGRIFPATYDRPHDVVAVINFRLTKNWECSSNFIYASGRRYTPIQSVFLINNRPNVEYGPRNSDKLKDYHRMDLSLIYKNDAKKNRKFNSSWSFSVYNLYNRKNPFFSYTDFESNILSGEVKAKAVNVSIFTLIPAVTWNFSWNSKSK